MFAPQTLNQLLAALHALRDNAYSPPDCLPRYWESAPLQEGLVQSEPHDLVTVSIPPEMYDVDQGSRESREGRTGSITFFGDDVGAIRKRVVSDLTLIPGRSTTRYA